MIASFKEIIKAQVDCLCAFSGITALALILLNAIEFSIANYSYKLLDDFKVKAQMVAVAALLIVFAIGLSARFVLQHFWK